MTEEMTSTLANLQPDRLGVIARTSAMQYKRSAKGVNQIADELGVDYVLESSVRRSDGRVRITAQLIQARDQTHVWAQTYERELNDVLKLQAEVAAAIANEITVQLSPIQERRLRSTRPVRADAYEAYLKGLFFWNKFTQEGMKKSIDYFQQAIQLDPDYAQPYARMARAYGVLGNFGTLRPEQAYPQQRDAALKALDLDPTMDEAHSALGWTKVFYEHDWAGARSEFQRAVDLNPNSATAHQGFAMYFIAMGQFDQSHNEILRAQELDPVSLNIKADVGWFLYYARRTDESIAQLKDVLEMDPNFSIAHGFLASAYQQKGMYKESIDESKAAIKHFDGSSTRIALLGYSYAVAGKKLEALQVLRRLDLFRDQYVSPYTRALIYTGLGQRDQAFPNLEKAYQDRNWMMAFLKVDPRLDPLRSDPRFVDLMRRMNFPS
jgi:TolB-like protein/Tfp pilus assembly protein PilF